ncbi:hypothetical protein G4B88_023133 [Cannabis sativa]|uniref:RNase H type-1 domain-containing protein n=1 Tax=Cannabis sativa TaxID=3483 RepID=A0A7J6G6I5_CANSA|nr:hypothetical protein G4B88_023133 [Cannabis sativa]
MLPKFKLTTSCIHRKKGAHNWHDRIKSPSKASARPIHLTVQVENFYPITCQSQSSENCIPDIDSSLLSIIKHLARSIYGVQFRVHIDKFGGKERILVRPIIEEVAINDEPIRERITAKQSTAKQMGTNLQSDCLQLVSKIHSSWKDNSALSRLVHQIREFLSLFPNDLLQHIPHSENQDAHLNAREALRLNLDSVWRI